VRKLSRHQLDPHPQPFSHKEKGDDLLHTAHPLFAVYCLLSTVCCLLFAVYCLLFTVCCLLLRLTVKTTSYTNRSASLHSNGLRYQNQGGVMRDELKSRVIKARRRREVGWHPRAVAWALARVRSFIPHLTARGIFFVPGILFVRPAPATR